MFVDTSALYALLDRRDRHHDGAATVWAELSAADPPLTHSYVLVETTALVQRRLGVAAVRALHEDLLPPVTIKHVDEDLYRSAVSALVASQSKEVSLVDFTSFELMRRLGIQTAFAFDADFARYGWGTLPS